MKNKIFFIIAIFSILSILFILVFAPKTVNPTFTKPETQEVKVSEYSSPGITKAQEYELGEFKIELKNQKNCTFQTSLSLAYEKGNQSSQNILISNETKLKELISSFISEQNSETLKTFQTEQNLDIELVNKINKFLKDYVVITIFRKNTLLNCS